MQLASTVVVHVYSRPDAIFGFTCTCSSLLVLVPAACSRVFLQISCFPPSRKKQCVLSFAVIVFLKKVCNCYSYGHSVVSEKCQVLLNLSESSFSANVPLNISHFQ